MAKRPTSSSGQKHADAAELDTNALSDRLLAESKLASDHHRFEVAYHALAAALHASEVRADTKRVTALIDEAQRQQSVVDSVDPNHRIASRPPSPGWFDALAVLGHALLARHKGNDLIREARESAEARQERIRAAQARLERTGSMRAAAVRQVAKPSDEVRGEPDREQHARAAAPRSDSPYRD